MTVELLLLGEVGARVDGRPVDLGHARQRCVLAALLVDANRVVPPDRLLDRVWGERPPQRARNALSGYVSRLRAVFAGTGVRFVRESGGYTAVVDPAAVDLHRFRALRAQGRLDEALALFTGEPFGSLDTPWIADVRTALLAERLAVELDAADLGLAAGRHAALLGELTERARAHPLDERVAGQLMRALAAAGRQADAVDSYHRLRARLAGDLGLDPGTDLQRLFQQILTGGPPRTPVAGAVPRQLPAPPPAFVGRQSHVDALSALLGAPGAPVAAVSGTAGAGKTTLALHWAHRVAGHFPDGQLYVNLRGFAADGSVLAPAEALHGFLTALGVTTAGVPPTVEERAALFRSLVAGRRVLVVLDNARDADHVRHLLPGAPGAVTVVTSRNQLGGLVAVQGARPVVLELFTADEARLLLASRLGAGRLAAEPAAADDIVTRCARLPLALSVVAARAAAHPRFRLADIADELTGLDPFTGGDRAADVRAVFSWSYRALPPAAARVFRLLGLNPLPEWAVPAVASLAGLPVPRARQLLAELAGANLVIETRPGRYTVHDLLRAYAAELAGGEDDGRGAATRLLDHLLYTAYAADRLIYPHRDPIMLDGSAGESIMDSAAAMRWLRTEHDGLRIAVGWAHREGLDRHAWELAWSLTSYFNLGGHWPDQIAVQRTALDAARRQGDGHAQAHAHRTLGRAYTQTGRLDDARRHLDRALELFEQAGDRANHAQTHVNIARVCEQRGHHADALRYDLRSLDLYRRAGHGTGEARALNNIACQYAHLGDTDRARAACEEALRRNEEIGNRHGAATNRQTLAHIHTVAGAPLAAVADGRHALRLFRAVGDRAGEADTLVTLADAHAACGDLDAAVSTWRQALPLLDGVRHPAAARVRARLAEPAPVA